MDPAAVALAAFGDLAPGIDFADLADSVLLDSQSYIGIPLALVGAVFLSLGTQYQHSGVTKVERLKGQSGAGLSFAHLLALLRRPSWVVGTLMLGLAIVLQLASLWFAPLIVVQPLGAVALVITAVVNSRLTRTRLGGRTVCAIVLCVAGVGAFVTVAAFTAVQKAIEERELAIVLVCLAVLLAVWGAVFLMTRRRRPHPMIYVVAAGTLYGFVATLAKVVMGRIQTLIAEIRLDARTGWHFSGAEWLTVFCVIGLIVAVLIGAYFVQSAHANGPPDLVVAGLTVVDPMVAVLIGIIVLHEADGAPWGAYVAYLATGAIAILGVFLLARHHPHMSPEYRETGEVPRISDQRGRP